MAAFADRVRINISDETKRLGLANREGQVYGLTTPSATGVTVIGSPRDDHAINVYFDELDDSFWFSEDLVETLDNGVGTVISLDGQQTEWIKLENGEWGERPRSD